jgi:hypothetical protein
VSADFTWPVCRGCRHRALSAMGIYVCALGLDRDRSPTYCPFKEVAGA